MSTMNTKGINIVRHFESAEFERLMIYILIALFVVSISLILLYLGFTNIV